MTTYEKKRKAAMIAAAYYMEQEKANAAVSASETRLNRWSRTGIEINMNKRQVVQLRGRVLLRA
ncbi:MAG: hypothetical protein LC658_12780 [Bacteroidales bacterium]|nr:hypothetical protein [Bacteroidales bacterium]